MKPRNFDKLITKDRMKEKVDDWQFALAAQEKVGLEYKFDRLDRGENSVSELHGVSFIRNVIPELIKTKKNGEKVRILDSGAGAAFFTDEIRKAFGDKVEVFSTGLSKEVALAHRKKNKPVGEHELHPNDLKWYSILQLSDFEEFDLIIDTFGEYYYNVKQGGFNSDENYADTLDHLTAVIKKLKPGGLASIVPTNALLDPSGVRFQSMLQQLEEQYGVTTEILEHNPDVLRIEKKVRVKNIFPDNFDPIK